MTNKMLVGINEFRQPQNGAHGGNRTRDLSLTKGVLYH